MMVFLLVCFSIVLYLHLWCLDYLGLCNNLVSQEAERSKKEKSKHSQWRNYDDLNEYFWYAL